VAAAWLLWRGAVRSRVRIPLQRVGVRVVSTGAGVGVLPLRAWEFRGAWEWRYWEWEPREVGSDPEEWKLTCALVGTRGGALWDGLSGGMATTVEGLEGGVAWEYLDWNRGFPGRWRFA
jgi:hypothetical protein